MRTLLWLLLLAQAGSFDTTFRAGLAALQQNDLSQAREQLESASQMELVRENRADVRNLLGKAYEADGRHAEAVREMREAVRLGPYDESYMFDLARDLLQHNQLQDATQLLEDGRKIFARSAQLELT